MKKGFRTRDEKLELVKKYEALRSQGVDKDEAAKQLGTKRLDIYTWKYKLGKKPASAKQKIIVHEAKLIPKRQSKKKVYQGDSEKVAIIVTNMANIEKILAKVSLS